MADLPEVFISYKSLFELKQKDYFEVCKECDALEKQLALYRAEAEAAEKIMQWTRNASRYDMNLIYEIHKAEQLKEAYIKARAARLSGTKKDEE